MKIVAWRLVRGKHLRAAFTGEGAAKFGGRWNSRGVRMVYASSTVALAALETLVHLNPLEGRGFKLIRIEFEDELIERLETFPRGWRSEPPTRATQRVGDNWVARGTSAILTVPSVLAPQEFNFLFNPAHPDFRRLRISKAVDFSFDPRLLG